MSRTAQRRGSGRARLRVDLAARRASVPLIRYDESLPVHARREQIAAAIAAHPVTIISGATGSGKSTQLPKICLELGRGIAGMIGHTQPRRIAAQALAARIAAELGTRVGDIVGYQVRFLDRTSPRTLIKLMTDGLLLRELERDPLLRRYDTLIVDEAHERNLNIDFLLGVCRRLLQRREDLKVIVTSATIETARFADFFGGAAVVEVEGRSYPVEVRYRPLEEEEESAPSLAEAVRDALAELATDAHGIEGDALVFLPGEKQIHEARDLLVRGAADWDVLPLYGRLTAQEQERIFAPHAKRRVVLATNVAETSITIPGVRFVIDAGLARISRYSPRAKFQRLPIEEVSQASAEQRKGRCGREGEGICIRLYSSESYASRPRYTDPEILRTNLASLILQMAALGLGVPENFPFIDAPDDRLLNDGYRLLQELSAVDGERRITRLGRQMAMLPVDPRLARMLLEAGRVGCLPDALVIAAFLSIQDPRERPVEKTEAADLAHARFADERSDFISVLNLWRESRGQTALGTRAYRRWCHAGFLSFLRMREWSDLHDQLLEQTAAMEMPRREGSVSSTALHLAILSGFLSGIGVLDEERTYLGARDARFVIARGSPLAKRTPRWIVAASLVETQRLYARMVAQVQPSWIETAGAHLVKRSYGEAEWDPSRGMTMARETVSLYGRVLSNGRRIDFATVDPQAARRIFIEEALLHRPSPLSEAFLERNDRIHARIEHLESSLRRRDLLASEDKLVQFYLERLPIHVSSLRTFQRWWQRERALRPDLLDAPEELFHAMPPPAVSPDDYPQVLQVDGNPLPLQYHFDPTSDDDGVTLMVPRPLLRSVPAQRLDWLVPGWLGDKVIALLRGLPKDIRRELVPIPESAAAFLSTLRAELCHGEGSLLQLLAEFVTQRAGTAVAEEQLAQIQLAPWLRMNLRVVDSQGRTVRQGRDLALLRNEDRTHSLVSPGDSRHSQWSREGLRTWDFGDLPAEIAVRNAGVTLRMYPTVEDAGDSVRLSLQPNPLAAGKRTRRGMARLAALALPQPRGQLIRQLAEDRSFALLVTATGFGKRLLDDIADRAVEESVLERTELPRTRAEFRAAVDAGRDLVVSRGMGIVAIVRSALTALREARTAMGRATSVPALASTCAGIETTLTDLFAEGWVRETPAPWFAQLPKYVRATTRRLQRAQGDVTRDARLQGELDPVITQFRQLCERQSPECGASYDHDELTRLRWMIEEFRLSLFAQELHTLAPISAKRLAAQLQQARRAVDRA